MAKKPQWGSRLGADPNMSFTMDFQDSDRDGVDDRMQRGPGQPGGKVGQDFKGGGGDNGNQSYYPGGTAENGFGKYRQPGQTTKTVPIEGPGYDSGGTQSPYIRNTGKIKQPPTNNQGQQGLDQGYLNFSDIMGQFFNYKPGESDDEGRAFKNAMMGDWMSKFFDSRLSREMGQYQSGLSKDMMNHQWNLEQMGQSNSRKEEFGYGMRSMDKQYELQNQYANQQYGRDIGMLSATGEQTRKNYKSQGVENRLQSITDNEQERLNIGARGDQDRKNETNRAQEERKSIDYTDRIGARKEERQRGRAKALARSF